MNEKELNILADLLVQKMGSLQQVRYMNLKEAGKYCGKSAESIRMLARRGRVRVIKMGKSIMIDRVDLDRAMEEMKLEIPAECQAV